MSTTPHLIAPEEIMAHLDGGLSADRAETVSTHIKTCPECRTLVQEFQQTTLNVAMWQVASLPAAIENRIQSAAAKVSVSPDTSSLEIFRRVRLWSSKQWLGGLVATATAAILLLGLFSGRFVARKAHSMPVDFARVNNRTLQEQEAVSAGRPVNGDSITGFDNLQLRPAATPSQALERAKSDLQMGSMPLQEKELKAVAGSTIAEPMIARTVSLSIVAKDFDAARASLDAILTRHHGYAANLSANTPQSAARSIQASLRIPAPQLAAALAELKSLGRVELENQNGEEVTQQHADLVARLKNSRETEQRLQAILTQRTGKISDVLEVEQEIARVRGEIEQMEAERKNLEHRVDFATIDLKLSEEYKAKLDSPTPSISTQLHNALVNGYRNVADTLITLLLFAAEYGPILLFWALLLFIPAWLVWRRFRHAHAV